MPLMVEGKHMGVPPKSVEEFLERYPHYKETSKNLLEQKCRSIVPIGLLYVGQREMAATTPDDERIQMVGTEDATTCHIAILRHTGSGAVCMCHFDSCGIETGCKKMLGLVKDLSKDKLPGRIELHLAGGFRDDKRMSEELSIKLLTTFNNLPEEIHLQTACITDINNMKKGTTNFPVIYGLVIHLNSGEIQRATFLDRGPDQPIRSARHFTGSEEIINIYDHKKGMLSIGPFNYSTMDEIDLLCRLPDQFIREHLSTSPEQEPAHFEDAVRAALVQIRDHPEPLRTVFKDGQPRQYKIESNGSWTRCN
ncbi:protein N-terminal asparagine amidohydrolase-like [Ostrea edulis]|uniref:protein N-terminal asparagine amidohydrolase-like n=1 Tax=Ostrea edulis TaxID=37623 RepID=UPI00209438E3|nr:protein N-terminal asparagine amidohydrolase-like [Ostrea edulis]XP_056018170.1 protein N-terminal asparagine amidohydrolase-like [Ostrea edulis]XP_056018172.1 protein N-terminal asparagine amidohydrolase-like [Ostrea edulis]XP_056018173.1 protein N-terminal asparagine amidohydrolase-like [Ostrea edulis]XP_056018174.1 protein N-terminal asparagine amidohydrolase-like [Ostrea edulis]XP_056018175.1 protein N-terminal asparagine amidohydrolase-like [Ostrea edulis]XP_056018176.1 protein N-term